MSGRVAAKVDCFSADDGIRVPVSGRPAAPGTVVRAVTYQKQPSGCGAREWPRMNDSIPNPTPRSPLARTMRRLADQRFADDPLYARRGFVVSAGPDAAAARRGPVDFLLVPPEQANAPAQVFSQLRWGGRVAILTDDRDRLRELAGQYQPRGGFTLESGPRPVTLHPLARLLPWTWGRPVYHALVARRTALISPGEVTDRFTFHVELVRNPRGPGYIVCKKVPTYGSVMVRLKERFPDVPATDLALRARKLVDKIFPVFLTREAGFLDLLQKKLPESMRSRVPRLLGAERGKDGLARRLNMTWLRLGAEPIDQLTFARQLTEFVEVLHEQLRIVHLDLRMDNVLVTDRGVGLVDFGSAVQLDEDLSQSQLLTTLFTEMMSTSHVQRLLGRMKESGRVTSEVLIQGHQKVDKAADLFYLAMQIANPHTSPDLVPLIEYDKESPVARQVSAMTRDILRPEDPGRPRYRNARDILSGLEAIEHRARAAPHPTSDPPPQPLPRTAVG